MKIPRPLQHRRARIEIIPLIDIVFFLLATFVMVSLSMIQNKGIAVKLPTSSTGTAQERGGSVTLSVNEKGVLYFDKEQVSDDELVSRLKSRYQKNPNLRVFIQGDEKASFGSAVKVLDQVRQLGITRVAIETDTERKL